MTHVLDTNAALSAVTRLWLGCACAACAMPQAPYDSDAGAPQLTLRAYDVRGVEFPLAAVSRRPELVLSSTRALAPDLRPLLFEGAPDAELLADLAALPLRAAHAARVVAARAAVSASGDALRLFPESTLGAAAPHTFALSGDTWFRDGSPAVDGAAPFVAEVWTAGDAAAGAQWLATLPPDGATGVPLNIREIVLTLDGSVQGIEAGVWVEGPDGLAEPADISPLACEDVEARAASCLTLVLRRGLAPRTRYRLRSGETLVDDRGAAVDALEVSFVTGAADDLRAPALEALACPRDERAAAYGCGLLSDASVRVRVRADEPVRLLLRGAGLQTAAALPDGAGSVVLSGLEPDQAFDLEVRAIDLAGNVYETRAPLRTHPPLSRLSITEVRADPAGPEPAQEYVEIANVGAQPIALEGIVLVDASDERPSVVSSRAELPAGARALVVSESFDPDDPLDPPPPPGVRLARAGASLTRSGLANAGEPVVLRDASGRRLSAVPARSAGGRGRCLQRLQGADPRSDGAEHFTVGPCSPGY